MSHSLVNKIALILMFISFSSLIGEENFILINGNTNAIITEFGPDINERVTPACSFNIVLSLMGYDSGVLKDEKSPIWDFQKGYDNSFETWKNSLTPESWMAYSCVWYSKMIGLRIGLEKIQSYLASLEYGNQDLSGGLTEPGNTNPAWISSSLKISLKEQVDFIQKMIHKKLTLSNHAIEMTKTILFKGKLDEVWRLYGKSGLGNTPGQDDEGLKIWWFVGWIENNDSFFPFAYQTRQKEIDFTQTLPRVKQLLKDSSLVK